MAIEIQVQNSSIVAAADLTTYQYRAVKISAAGLLALCGAGENGLGILQDEPNITEVGNVMILGESKCEFGGTVTAGQNLASDAVGRLVTAGGSDAVIAIAKESGAVGEVRTVILVTRTSSGTNTKSVVSFPILLASIADGDIVTGFTPGFAGSITKFQFVVTAPATTAGKLSTINLEIGTTNVTGGVISLTSANCTPLGATVAGTAITALNVFTASDTISIEASATTAFIEGSGVFLITLG